MTNYVEKTGSDNPFDGISANEYSAAPVLVDIDGDGDLDLALGSYASSSHILDYYQNDGTRTNPSYVAKTGADNPFDNLSIEIDSYIRPSFGDVDKDGDLDLIIGDGYGFLNFYENDGSSTNPNYVERTDSDNPFSAISSSYSGRGPALVDMDDDGDADLVVDSSGDGYLQYFQNDPTTTGANYTEKTGSKNPFDGVSTGYGYVAPIFVDFDDDGDLDALAVNNNGDVSYLERTGSNYTLLTAPNNPVSNVQVNYENAATAGDIDNDGDLDIVVGNGYGYLKFYEDSRTAPALTFSKGETSFEVTSLGSGDTLMLELDSVSQFSEVLIFRVDDAVGSHPVQVANFSVLETGPLPSGFSPSIALSKDLVEAGQFFQIQLVEDGMTRLATMTQLGSGQLALDFGQGTVLTIQPAAEGAPNLLMGDADGIDVGNSGNPMSLEFIVYREASYDNTVGLYTTDTADGGITVADELTGNITGKSVADRLTGKMLMPGDEGYKEAAMSRRLDVALTGENGKLQSFSAELSGSDRFVASFLIADGSDFSSSEVYFSHLGANGSGNDHAKLLGLNTFGFEDMANLGDRDYNDIVVQFIATENLSAIS